MYPLVLSTGFDYAILDFLGPRAGGSIVLRLSGRSPRLGVLAACLSLAVYFRSHHWWLECILIHRYL